MCDRQPYQFKRCMRIAWSDIKRVWRAYITGAKVYDIVKVGDSYESIESGPRYRCGWGKNCIYMRYELRCIIMEIKHGIFDQGK